MIKQIFAIWLILLPTYVNNFNFEINEKLIEPIKLNIFANEVTNIDLIYHLSTFEPYTKEYSFQVVENRLVGGDITLPLSLLNSILQNLDNLYPSTNPVYIERWSDDYPFAGVKIALKDERYILITSQSQYGRLIPWNVQIWQGNPDTDGNILESYILLHEDFHKGLSVFWNRLTGTNFPRDYGDEAFWEYYEKTETVDFFRFSEKKLYGSSINVIEPFLSTLKQNKAISELLQQGYFVYDLDLDVTVTVEQMHPVSYSGSIALMTPNKKDVIVSTVDIYLEPEILVKTPLISTEVIKQVSQRQEYIFLQNAEKLFPDIVFLSYFEEKTGLLKIDCPENHRAHHSNYGIEAFLSDNKNLPIYFYYLNSLKAWSVNIDFNRQNGYWDDELVNLVLDNWFPVEFASLRPSDLVQVATAFRITFQPNVTDANPEIIESLQKILPLESKIHIEHPQKQGDMSVIDLNGRVILPEKGNPYITYCDYTRPYWYGAPYNVSHVLTPIEAERLDFDKVLGEEIWTPVKKIQSDKRDFNDAEIGTSMPGFVHLLWATRNGVYYADGWADGSGWIQPQRLGDDSYDIRIVTNVTGEVHLLWQTFDPTGTIHVWRNVGGIWQKPEYWAGVSYFTQLKLDSKGTLHLTYSGFAGVDSDLFYRTWSEEQGLSEIENISRRLGNGGRNLIQLDTKENVHAAWIHPLSSSQYIDPLSGEIFDEIGVFYSSRLGDSNWTLPEQIGVLADFAYSMDFILTNENEPVVAWQSDEGVVVSIKKDQYWSKPYLLGEATPPKTPAPFGPERWGEITAEIKLAKDQKGNIYAVWMTQLSGIFLSKWNGIYWSVPQQISGPGSISSLKLEIDLKDNIHLLYFKDDNPNDFDFLTPLTYSLSNEENITTTVLPINYEYYGIDESQLIVDKLGFVYVLGLPRSPEWLVYIPLNGIKSISTAATQQDVQLNKESILDSSSVSHGVNRNHEQGNIITGVHILIVFLCSLFIGRIFSKYFYKKYRRK